MAAAVFQGTLGHLANRLFADSPMDGQGLGGNPQGLDFRCVAVGDESTFEPFRASWNIGQHLGNPSAGTGFGGNHFYIFRLQVITHMKRQLMQITIHEHKGTGGPKG